MVSYILKKLICKKSRRYFNLPNIKSAKKRVKLIKKKTLRNKSIKTNLKTILKKANTSILELSATKEDDFKLAIKKLDQAVSKGVLHKNSANRKKSKLALEYNKTTSKV